MNYIFNAEGKCVASCNYKPNVDDLKSRNEVMVENENIYEPFEIKLVDGAIVVITETLDQAKTRYIADAGLKFAKRRDAITWTQHEVGLYGYDRKPEDVTNFLAAMKRAELGLETGFNVYVDSIGPKQFLPHTYDMFKVVLEQSANEQIAAYQWYEGIKSQLQAATSIEELEQIYSLGGE